MEIKATLDSSFLSSFTLAGHKNKNGLTSYTGAKLREWPTHVTLEGITFSLEQVEVVGEDPKRGKCVNAHYC